MPNRLIDENSPYLLQHADNPVDWYPWSEEALAKALSEDKPIFLSIGYAACHWCHVMAHESFEDSETAAIMNEHFVNIKIDREERPDLDSIYMEAVIALTGQGGWPTSVFLTPDAKPFFGGTYYPPDRRYNMPSFKEVLLNVRRAWDNDREQILTSSQQITDHLLSSESPTERDHVLNKDILDKASLSLAQSYDWKHGGWGSAPKFPQPMAIEYLLHRASRGDNFALEIATHALLAMAKGGMYDLIGGGFSRYSTDNSWLVPHFEKMLYDNALLARVYLHAYLLTGNIIFKRVCEGTLEFIAREMTHHLGGFYSSLDADSEGIEGKYYVWTWDEIKEALPDPSDVEFIQAAYNVTESGNFEGSNVLQNLLDDEELSVRYHLPIDEVQARITSLNDKLLHVRETRVPPSIDDKVLVEWNALALIAFSEVGRYIKRYDFVEMATRNAQFILTHMVQDGRLSRSWRDNKALHNAYLSDYAGLILGLLSLYQSQPDPHWFATAIQLTEEMIEHFHDPQGGFYDTRDDHEKLLRRPKTIQDSAIPSGNSLAAHALLQVSAYTGRGDWRSQAEAMISSVRNQAVRYPTSFGYWLCATDLAVSPFYEVALLGEDADPKTQSLLDTLWKTYRPNLVVARSSLPLPPDAPPLLYDRSMIDDLPTVYVCQNFVCKLPVNSPNELNAQLDG